MNKKFLRCASSATDKKIAGGSPEGVIGFWVGPVVLQDVPQRFIPMVQSLRVFYTLREPRPTLRQTTPQEPPKPVTSLASSPFFHCIQEPSLLLVTLPAFTSVAQPVDNEALLRSLPCPCCPRRRPQSGQKCWCQAPQDCSSFGWRGQL